MEIKLYTTAGCHLCEQAEALLHSASARGFDITIREVEIAESDILMARYGIRIPVIQPEGTELELGWPFTYADLEMFLQSIPPPEART